MEIHLVICGGESGPKARPMHPDWARGLRDQCKAAGVPFFFKQWGEWEEFDPGQPIHQLDIQTHRYCAERYWEMAKSPCLIDLNGKVYNRIADLPDNDTPARLMSRVGKSRAGHLLDGVEHHEFPNAIKLEK